MRPSLSQQVGGNHYKTAAIQPFEFSLANGLDAAAHSILKYVHRHADKGGLEDLRKADHIADIRYDLLFEDLRPRRAFDVINGRLYAPLGELVHVQPDPRISMATYIEANKIPDPEADTLRILEDWYKPSTSNQLATGHKRMKAALAHLINIRYGGTPE